MRYRQGAHVLLRAEGDCPEMRALVVGKTPDGGYVVMPYKADCPEEQPFWMDVDGSAEVDACQVAGPVPKARHVRNGGWQWDD